MLNDYSQIKQVVSVLVHDFTLSSSANSRKGGLVGLAATAIALGRVRRGGEESSAAHSVSFLQMIVHCTATLCDILKLCPLQYDCHTECVHISSCCSITFNMHRLTEHLGSSHAYLLYL